MEGALVDKSSQLILAALSRAAAEPGGLRLHGNRKSPGLFPASAAARTLAQRCKDEGYLRVLSSESQGKSVREVCALTDKGLAFVLEQTGPRQVLEDLVRTLESQRGQVEELVAAARRWQASLDSLRATVALVLGELQHPRKNQANAVPMPSVNGSEHWKPEIETYLRHWQGSGASADCPLPKLYQQALMTDPHLSIGRFHDGLRQLHDQERIYLHPWTGPLYEMPEPACALLIGHEVAYYASPR
jgi:hypothetical protein